VSRTYSFVIADFNDDDRLDLGFAGFYMSSMNVLLGNGDGTFGKEVMSLQNQIHDLEKMSVGDFNNDNLLDLAAIDKSKSHVLILLGNGDGSFRNRFILFLESGSTLSGLVVTHFNNDRHLDIAVTIASQNTVNVFLGKGDGTFSARMILNTGINSYPVDIAVADFNRDGYQDIIVVNQYSRNIGILLGHGNGIFEAQKTYFTGGFYDPLSLGVGDFNNDSLLDIVVSYRESNFINVMFGCGNGTVGNSMRFYTRDAQIYSQIFVIDFNGDGYLDIGFGIAYDRWDLFVGDGNGNFEAQTVFSAIFSTAYPWLGVGDFNGDDYQDVIYVSGHLKTQDIFLNRCE
jgi:hypothetical protein